MKPMIIVTLILILHCGGTILAAIIHVPADQPTIQQGITEASAGDTVLVADGSYLENIDFKGKPIIVQSVNGPASCAIDGSAGAVDNLSTVYFGTSDSTSTIMIGFSVINGELDDWGNAGGITCHESSPIIRNCIIYNNRADNRAGVLIRYGTPKFFDCTITGNHAVDGGAGGVSVYNSQAEFTRCVISGNTATESGGGIHIDQNSDVMFKQCTIENNTADWSVGVGQASGLAFWGAGFNAGTFTLIGDLQFIEWAYQ